MPGLKFLLDFLFPKSRKILELESLDAESLLSTLPRAEPINKDTLAIFDYKNSVVKEIVWQIKYKGNKNIAHTISEVLADFLNEEIEELKTFEPNFWKDGEILLVPIPTSDKRRAERGWNQAELISEAIALKSKNFKYLPRQLIKSRHTDSQTQTSSRKERLENLKESMQVLNPERLRGKSVILIDDVTTTGATFKEARRALEKIAKRVLCLAVAH